MGAFGKLATHKGGHNRPPQQEPDPRMAYLLAGLVPNGTLSGKGAPKWCVTVHQNGALLPQVNNNNPLLRIL